MGDERDFPTAIVPTRPGGVAERYDALARQFGDPLARMFALQNSEDEEMQFRASAELLPYRYPKLRANDLNLGVNAAAAGTSITINIGAPPDPVAAAVDVTPRSPPESEPSPADPDPLA